MKDEPRPQAKHELDHAIPTVIHHPEDDMPVLARWVSHAMENPTRFWTGVVGLIAAVIGVTVLVGTFSVRNATSDEAWSRLEVAKTPAERVELAKEFAGTKAARWARLQAASEFYNDGFRDLPANRDAALPALRKALDLFEEVAHESGSDEALARAAEFGAARTLEARGELDKAIKTYEGVAKTWPKSDEARHAEQLAAALRRPETAAFYKQLYAYKPVEVTLPPGGKGGVSLPPNHPPLDGSSPLAPFMIPPPPPSPGTKADAMPSLPLEPFTLPPPPSRGETPAVSSELPADPFAPVEAGVKP